MCRGPAPWTRGISAEVASLRVSLLEWLAPIPARFHESGGRGFTHSNSRSHSVAPCAASPTAPRGSRAYGPHDPDELIIL